MGLLDYFTPKSPAEKLRENKRLIDRAVRELDRERVKLENQEKLIVVEMKKMAKIGQKTMKSQQSMATALVGVTRTMKSMNTALKLNSLQKVASDFERMIEVQGIKQEMFSESIDQVLSSEYEAQEADELVNKIYDEVGLSFSEKLASTPASGRIAVETDKVSLAADDVDLLSRLESLRKL